MAVAEKEAYCPECGEGVRAEASFCDQCGADLEAPGARAAARPTPSSAPPTWRLAAMFGLWITWWVALASSSEAIQALALPAVLGSLPLLWLDARDAKRARILEVSRPIYVVVGVLILWALTLPAYLGYRVYKQRERSNRVATYKTT